MRHCLDKKSLFDLGDTIKIFVRFLCSIEIHTHRHKKTLTGREHAVILLLLWKRLNHSAKHMFPLTHSTPSLHTHTLTIIHLCTITQEWISPGSLWRGEVYRLITADWHRSPQPISPSFSAQSNRLIVHFLKDKPPLNICFTVSIAGELNSCLRCHYENTHPEETYRREGI